MQLCDLTHYTQERCMSEQRILYLMSYWGRDLNESKSNPESKKDRPMWIAAGILHEVNPLRQGFFEICLYPPCVHLDPIHGNVCWDECPSINYPRSGDRVTFDREEHERDVLAAIETWKECPLGPV